MLYNQNCGLEAFCNTFLFLLATRVLPAPNFGQANTAKTAPQTLFVNRVFVSQYVRIISPVGPIPISLFVFELEAEW